MAKGITASRDLFERLDRFFEDFLRAELERPESERNARNLLIGRNLHDAVRDKLGLPRREEG